MALARCYRPEILVAPTAPFVEQHVQGVVKIVEPLRFEAVPANLGRLDDPRAVEVALGNQVEGAAGLLPHTFEGIVGVFPEVHGAGIVHRVNGIQPQAV
jgi:hypothetical protein